MILFHKVDFDIGKKNDWDHFAKNHRNSMKEQIHSQQVEGSRYFSLPSTHDTTTGILSQASPLCTTESNELERIHHRGTKMMKEVDYMLYEERIRNLEKKANEGLDFSFQLPKGGYGQDEGGLFLEVHSEKTRCSGHKLQQRKFRLAAKKEYSP
ncbi:hypothetical protein QYF61_011135 [Mycteria americana]|uniref:Uncharacterized protein n=1 Tax=Mycteria americana TaxID=33587 RepID=A0AAN7NRR6_MYCAM|nr:hypothetical protein QYF61_011135 [Mycteria americana]